MLGDRGPLDSHRRLFAIGMLAVALPQLAIGIWAIAAPRAWFDEFPGGGREWLPVFGPYNEHLAVDAGAGLFATSVLLVLAAVSLERRVVQVALTGWLAFAIPHTAYHYVTLDRYGTADAVANGITLTLTVVIPLALLWLTLPREHAVR